MTHRRRPRTVLGVAGLLSVLLIAPAGASAPATAIDTLVSPLDAAAPAGSLLGGLGGDGVPLRADVVASRIGEVVTERWSTEAMTTARPLVVDERGDAADEEAQRSEDDDYTGAFAYAGGLGYDATGDGLEDVAAYEVDAAAGEVTLSVWDGVTGQTVFAVPTAADDLFSFTVFEAGDRSGDGITDLVQLRFAAYDDATVCTEDEDDFSYECTFDESFTWAVDLISGATGERLHTRVQEGFYRGYDRYDDEGFAYDIQARNLFPIPLPTADHDADGVADLVVHDTDYDVSGASGGEREADIDTVASVLDAAWLPLATFEALDRQTEPTLLPAGDLTGDGMPDLLWSTEVDLGERTDEDCPLGLPLGLERTLGLCGTSTYPGYGIRIELVDGATFATASDITVEDSDSFFWFAFPIADEDLDGDGAVDLRLVTFGFDDTEILRIDPADGRTLWTYRTTDFVGGGELLDLDADGADELVLRGTLTSSVSGPTEESTTVTFTQTSLDAASGVEEQRSSATATRDHSIDAFVFAGGLSAVDLNGDGIADPVMRSIFGVYDEDADTYRFESISRVLDATDISRVLLDRDTASVRFLADEVRAPSAASPQLLELDLGEDLGDDATATVIDGASGVASVSFPGVDGISTIGAADGSDELIISDVVELDRHVSGSVVRSRIDGVAVWSRLFG